MIYKYADNMGNNPASVNIRTGVVTLNRDMWEKLTDYEKAIILLHEEGHYINNTLNEIKADIYCIEQYMSRSTSPTKRQNLFKTVFKLVPDDNRKIEFVKNLFRYDADCNNNQSSKKMLQELDTYTANFAVTASTVATIIGIGSKVVLAGIDFWNKWQKKQEYWANYDEDTKRKIISEAGKAAVFQKFLETGGDFGATLAAANLPASDPNSLWYLAFGIIASQTKFELKEFNLSDNKTRITLEQASGVWWSKQGYQSYWFRSLCNSMKSELEQTWKEMSFFEKLKFSDKYKLYLVLFLVACFVVWKIA